MKPGSAVFFFTGVLLFAGVSTGGEPPAIVAVPEIQDKGSGLDPALLAMLTDRLKTAMAEGKAFRVATQEEAGQASRILSTSITRSGATCMVASSLHDNEARKVEVSIQEYGPCTDEGLEKSMEKVAFKFVFWADRSTSEKQVEIVPSGEPIDEQPAGAQLPVQVKSEAGVGPVSDVFLTIGFSTNKRYGLHPRHESDTEYGLRIDGRFFLGTLVDNPYLAGIGVGGYYNTLLGAEYGIPGGDTWDTSQHQWQVEALYRFALDEVFLKPTFIFRAGYGATSCVIDTEHALAVSAAYAYPYAALDFYLMILEPFIRVHISAGYLFAVDLGEDLSGSGSGYTIRGGLDLAFFGHLHAGWGMEVLQFSIDDDTIGDTSDSYTSMYFRVGWNFR